MVQTKGPIRSPKWENVSISLKEVTYIRDVIEREGEITSRGFGPNLPDGYYREQQRIINKAYKNKTSGQDKNFEIFVDDLKKINLAESFKDKYELGVVTDYTEFVISDEGLDHTFIQKVFCKIREHLKEQELWNE